MALNQLYFDEYEDVLASTDLLAIVSPGLRKQPSNWKWMILAAHNGLQGALVCAIQDTSATNILSKDSATIPDLHFNIQMLISDPPYVASRLGFDCTPKGTFLGLHVGGKRVSFTENVFYEFRREKIREVWSVIDKAAIEAQLLGP